LSPTLPLSLAPIKPANPGSLGKMAIKMERNSTAEISMAREIGGVWCETHQSVTKYELTERIGLEATVTIAKLMQSCAVEEQ